MRRVDEDSTDEMPNDRSATVPRVAYVVSHTHWDREWYQTHHEFRVQLVDVVRQALDALEGDPEFRHFMLDGQAIIVEDYLSVVPGDAERIRSLVRAGALSVGPWYILPDEFLVSGEATVRNLMVGHQVGDAFGGVQKVGYMPDSFGHIAQLPQILRQVGIDSFIYTRGNGDEIEELGYEYRWQAPDGSEVLAINQHGGYCNAGALGFEEGWHARTQREPDPRRAVEQVRTLFDGMHRLSRGDIYLVNNGCDHLPPQQALGTMLRALRQAMPETEFHHTSMTEYLAAVREHGFANRHYAGELISGKLHFILSGVRSSRMYLKQQNDRAQTLLAHCLEPVSCYVHFLLGQSYPRGLIDSAWKLLLQNHPHDSICGCSTDHVHRDMESRFGGVIGTSEQILRRQLTELVPTWGCTREGDRSTVICVMNPLPEVRTEVVERLVVLQPPVTDPGNLALFDEAGVRVPWEIVSLHYVERFWGIDYRTELFADCQRETFQGYHEQFFERMEGSESERNRRDCFLTIRFVAENLPALGHTNFYLRESAPGVETAGWGSRVTVTEDSLENELIRVRLRSDGRIDLVDKRSGKAYPGLSLLEDTEDVGDEYDYSPAERTETVTPKGGEPVRVLEAGAFRGRLEANTQLSLPSSVTLCRDRRSDDRVACPVTVRVGVTPGSPVVDVELVIDNRARDHRLRAVFPTGVASETVVSDGHFYLNRRPVQQPAGADWRQPPSGTYPQQDFTLVQDGERGLAILNRGLPEIAAEEGPNGTVTLSLTLLRCVGWLSRDDFDTRSRSNAGPTVPTPDAQCLGDYRCHYAVLPFSGDYLEANVKGISQRYRTPVLVVQGVAEGHVPGTRGLLGKKTTATAITAVKKHQSRQSVVVRLYNLSGVAVDETLVFGPPVEAAWRTDLLEERLFSLRSLDATSVAVPLEPYEIATVEVTFVA